MDKNLLNVFSFPSILNDEAFIELIMTKEKEQYLAKHPYSIWQNESTKKWYTHLMQNGKRKLIKRASRQDLEDYLVQYYKSQSVTFGDAFYAWLEERLNVYQDVTLQTKQRYEADYRKYISGSILEDIPVTDITEDYLEHYIRKTIAQHGMTAKAWGNLRIIIRGALGYARSNKYTSFNVNTFLTELKLGKNTFAHKRADDSEQVFTNAEVKLLLDHLEQDDSATSKAIQLAFYTGLRVGELVALTRSDVFSNYVYVTKTEVHYQDPITKKKVYEVRDFPKTQAGNRKVAITTEAVKIFNSLQETEYLFMSNGKRIHGPTVYAKLVRVCKKLGIKPKSPHKIRKTYATTLIDAGVSAAAIMNQLGHTDIRTTEKYYYFNNKTIDAVASTLDGVLDYR